MPASVNRLHSSSDDLTMLVRFSRDFPRYLRRPISPTAARELVRRRFLARDARFLAVAERLIYGQPTSPIRHLLRNAGCEPGDLQRLVTNEGLDAALRHLATLGVYLTYDEIQGRREVVRGSLRLSLDDRDLDNPLFPPHFAQPTSGSGSAPRLVRRSLRYMTEAAASVGAALDAHGIQDARHVYWMTAPLSKLLYFAKLGQPVEAWFHPISPLPTRVGAGSLVLAGLARLGGYQLPLPAYLDLNDPARLVHWLRDWTGPGQPLVSTTVSAAVRTAVAASEAGVSLDHVTFIVQGEPITEARKRLIEAAKAHVIAQYGSAEVLTTAYACPHPTSADDLHLFEDRYAAITRARPVSEGGPEVDALLLTTLSLSSARTYLNVETGDYARLERRDCGCGLSQIGLRTHLSEIRSFEKLTGEGMTVVRTNLFHVLEEILPRRFGGTSLDYQLIEQDGHDSVTRLMLRIHPSVGEVDDAAVKATLLDALAGGTQVDAHMMEIWRRANTVTVSREPPLATRAGKILPFQLVQAQPAVNAPGV
jgi:hypothetical protein